MTALSPAPSVSIVASSEGVSGTATLTIVPPPRLVLDSTHVAFSANAGGALPGVASLTIQNGGGGTLGGLDVAPIRYETPTTGWLAADAFGDHRDPHGNAHAARHQYLAPRRAPHGDGHGERARRRVATGHCR